MARTQHFGFNKFGPEGRLSDEGHKYTLKDRELLDAILFELSNHDHRAVSNGQLSSPSPDLYPVLVLASTGGLLPAGQNYYYKISYVDATGNETASTAAGLISTPTQLSTPGTQVLTTANTGGTLTPGTYKYALAYYQSSGGVTTAPAVSTIIVPTGTNTNTVTIPLPTLPDGANGWKIYRRGPGDVEYWLLDTQASGPTTYVDDGSVSPDCTQKRPVTNTTNSTNKITISIPAALLPLDNRIVGWRIYRTSTAGSYPSNSLVATVAETTTEGGSDLVTSYEDTGGLLSTGIPLSQTAVPMPVPQLDAAGIFGADSARLPSALAPLGVQSLNLFVPGALTARTYFQFQPPHDILAERIDAYFLTAPTGLSGANYLRVRFQDDFTANEVQSLYNDAVTQNEVQRLSCTATGGTFTLSDGVDTTSAIAYNASAATIETRLETDITSIVDVQVLGSGTVADPWVIIFINPGATNVNQLTVNTGSLTGGTATMSTSINGSNGGTFTLSDGVDTTSAIAYNASAATIATRLETDITSIVDVTVTGTGISSDPWVITFVNPGATDVAMLVVNDASLNGQSFISQVTKGHGATTVDLVVNQNQAAHAWQSSLTDYGSQEAETSPATGGVLVSDTLALNDVAMELDAQNETNSWTIGTLDPGSYTFRFWVSDYDKASTFTVSVIDTVGPTTLATLSVGTNRSVYTPAYELDVTLDGTETIKLEVKKTDASANRVRVDKYEYEVNLPTLKGESTVTVSVTVTGTPTTNGSDVNLALWY